MSDRINLEDSVASVIHGNWGVKQYMVRKRRNGLLKKDLSGVF